MERILPIDAPEWAEQLAQLVASAQPTGGVRPVLTLQEAMDFTGCASCSAFYRWMSVWAPRACCSHGRYTRSALGLGMEKEAMERRHRSRRLPQKREEMPKLIKERVA